MLLPRRALVGLAAAAAIATALNLHWLDWNGDRYVALESGLTRAELGALEIARGEVPARLPADPATGLPAARGRLLQGHGRAEGVGCRAAG